jgi:hypothetical protein
VTVAVFTARVIPVPAVITCREVTVLDADVLGVDDGYEAVIPRKDDDSTWLVKSGVIVVVVWSADWDRLHHWI